jgi:AraC family transcriptional regulator
MNQIVFIDAPRPTAGPRISSSEDHTGAAVPVDATELLDEIRAEMECSPEGARAAALRLVALLTPQAAAGSTDARGGLAPWQKRRVDRYLREHLDGPLRLKQLAQQASLSVSHFCHAFKESFGTTPHMHIIRLRIELAQQLMLTTLDPLSDIALACGLADQAHLSKLFRRWVGATPNAWRRQNVTDVRATREVVAQRETRTSVLGSPPDLLRPLSGDC